MATKFSDSINLKKQQKRKQCWEKQLHKLDKIQLGRLKLGKDNILGIKIKANEVDFKDADVSMLSWQQFQLLKIKYCCLKKR